MHRVILAGLRAHKLRLLLTAVAVVLGVGFVAGTLTFGDTAKVAFFDQFASSARHVDAAVEQSSDDRLPPSMLDAVRRVPGVAAADGRMSGTVPMLGRDSRLLSNFGAAGVGYNVTAHTTLHDYTVSTGRLPAHHGEVALDVDTARHERYRPGDTITVVDTEQHKHTMTLTGTVHFATAQQGSAVLLTRPDLVSLTGHSGYHEIVASAAKGVDAGTLTGRVRDAVGPGATVKSGDAVRHDLADSATSNVDIFLTAILIFGVIALVVSAFVIYNTFTILVAQRSRELALLRCIGASRRQVAGSVLAESAAVGLVGAVIGLVFGLVLAYLLTAALTALGLAMPAHPLVLSARTVLVGLAVGVGVTVVSALLPALSSMRVAPIAALRAPTAGVSGGRRRAARVLIAVLIAGVGVALTVAGATSPVSGGAANTTGMLLVVAGGLVVFLGLVVLSPMFLGRLIALVGWLPGRLFGVPARLASANARRNPGRVAATTTALMIGVALMAIFSVVLSTVRSVSDAQLAKSFPADYFLSSTDNGTHPSIPDGALRQLRQHKELSGVAARRSHKARLGGHSRQVSALDPGSGTSMNPTVAEGSMDNLGTGDIALYQPVADRMHESVGDTVRLSVNGHRHRFRVVAIYSGSMAGQAILSWSQFGSVFGSVAPDEVLVRAASGVGADDSRAAVDAAVHDYPLVQVSSMADIRQQLNGSLDSLLGIFAALLGISIIIALFGIANTLSLSVFERTRESAMLRALGLTRGQLRGMLLVEALLMAVVGAVIGIAFGIVYGAAATRAALGSAGGLHIPVGQLALYLALAATAGVLAAVLPARRAARTSIVGAIADA